MNRNNILLAIALLTVSTGCGDADAGTERTAQAMQKSEATAPNAVKARDARSLNINILVDLSNRIDPAASPKSPDQLERDLAVVRYFAGLFRQDVNAKGAFKANSSLRVFFHPEPRVAEVSDAAQRLVAECRSGNTAEVSKRNQSIYRGLDSNLNLGMRTIYGKSIQLKQYPGSDIWRFMKDEAGLKCIRDTNQYRNILVMLTDGYLYHRSGLESRGNRHNHIERNLAHFTRFRDRRVLERDFDAGDYGFIPVADLQGLEVLVMEVSPAEAHPQDFDIMRRYWEKWLTEMKVDRHAFFKSQQPAYVENLLNGYFNGR